MKTKAFSISSIQVKRCTWTKEEDQLLLDMVQRGDSVDWNRVANALTPLRPQNNPPKTSKQCRERWHNRLNPTIKQSPWTDEEVDLFFKLYQCHGPKWSKLACEIPGRTDNTIKNFFYCRLRKVARQIKKGIIPEAMKESAREAEYNIFLMNYLRNYYKQSRTSAHLATDKYISDMIRSTGVTYEMIGRYLKEYKRATKCVFHGSDTDDSFTKLPGTGVFHLPVPPKTKEDDASGVRSSRLISQSDATFLMQLLTIESTGEKIVLPPPRKLETSCKAADTFRPTIDFLKKTLYDPNVLISSYLICNVALTLGKTTDSNSL